MHSATLDQLVSLAKRRGFVYPTSEIYGGLANSYDYGPLGAQLLKNIRDLWWHHFIESRPDMTGIDSQIIQHPQTWIASGHVAEFNDPLVEDLITHKRYRADHVIETWLQLPSQQSNPELQSLIIENLSLVEMEQLITKHHIVSPEGNPLSAPKGFNLLFETAIGAVTGEKSKVYLRGETAQGIFANFKQILDSTRMQLPFGVGQIGKSFRNEVTTGQFVFRTLEMEQAEIEYFFNPQFQEWQTLLNEWKEAMWQFVHQTLGIEESCLRWRQHTDQERSHYSLDTYDLEYQFPFGFKELWGVAYRTDYDLKQHQQFSGTSLEYRDPQTGESFIPHVIEPALGIGRAFLMVLHHAYWHDEAKNRIVLRFKPSLAPITVAVFPLLKNKPELVTKAKEIYHSLLGKYRVVWDDRGNIGKRYLSQDEIGTPFCLTIDFETLDNDTITVRERDSAAQTRISLASLTQYLDQNLR
ncbi:MAG TPA: glycine--tRNA ligase [Candidatus Woesebacteria bacterium]|nr:glycine--tRNA ligase [Candidatus Woesebacteria bacterium]